MQPSGQFALKGYDVLVEDSLFERGMAVTCGMPFLPEVMEGRGQSCGLLERLWALGAEHAGRLHCAFACWDASLGAAEAHRPLIEAVAGGQAKLGVGLDFAGGLRLAAAAQGLSAFSFFHAKWLTGTFSLAPSTAAFGLVATSPRDLWEVVAALLPDEVAWPAVLLDAREERGIPCFPQVSTIRDDPETVAWLRQRFSGAASAFQLLASCEAADRQRAWLGSHAAAYPISLRSWLSQGSQWLPEEVRRARQVEAEILRACRELWLQVDGVLLPARPFAPLLARLPAWTAQDETGDAYQLLFKN